MSARGHYRRAQSAAEQASPTRFTAGMRFGRWTLQEPVPRVSGEHASWRCVCDCGYLARVDGYSLARGHSQSCGCLAAERKRGPDPKLTESHVREIRARLAAGETQTRIAKAYGVSQNRISRIKRGKQWAHV